MTLLGSGSARSSHYSTYEDVSAPAPSFANRSQFTRDKSWDQGGPKLGAQPVCYGALGPSLWSLAWFLGGHVTPGLLKAPCGDCPSCCPEVEIPSGNSGRQMISLLCPGSWLCKVSSLLTPTPGSGLGSGGRGRPDAPSWALWPRSSASSELHLRRAGSRASPPPPPPRAS